MLPTYASYCATKAAVEQLTRIFAKEVGQRGITVNVVSPGPTNTELFTEGKSEADIQRLAADGGARTDRPTGRHRQPRAVPGQRRGRLDLRAEHWGQRRFGLTRCHEG